MRRISVGALLVSENGPEDKEGEGDSGVRIRLGKEGGVGKCISSVRVLNRLSWYLEGGSGLLRFGSLWLRVASFCNMLGSFCI